MAEEDVIEQILIGLDVKDLIRYKSVCKSWHSLITTPRFINRHLNHSYNRDHCNNRLRHRRIVLDRDDNDGGYYLVGSDNGLVCISDYSYRAANRNKLMVVNPLTRMVRQLELPPSIDVSLHWGFGYDSSRDDYKVIVCGWRGMYQPCVHVFSLKSNVWNVIDVKYIFISMVGVLFNGALHWFVRDKKNKSLIISYDLSKEEFKEIPQPDDARYSYTCASYLGIIQKCLCISSTNLFSHSNDIWLMKNYDVEQSWVLMPLVCFDMILCRHDWKYDVIHLLRSPKDESFFHDDKSWLINTMEYCDFFWERSYIDAPIFVQSLVSPHVDGRSGRSKGSR